MALIRNDLVCNGSLVEPPSAALKGYLWVADPRQVSFFCAAKRKSPKKRPPRSHRPLRGFLCCAGMHECRGRRGEAEGATVRRTVAPPSGRTKEGAPRAFERSGTAKR